MYNLKFNINSEIYVAQISKIQSNKMINKFNYYDGSGKLIKEETFLDNGDISYNSIDGDCIYSYGPGGLYKTDTNILETIKLSDKDINIVKFFDGNMFYYENIGYKDNSYSSKVCGEYDCIDLNMVVVDFAIDKNYNYILGLDSLYIYKDFKLIKTIDLSHDKVYQKILNINNHFYLLSSQYLYRINNSAVEKQFENDIITDSNFLALNINDNELYIFDRNSNRLSVLKEENEAIDRMKTFDVESKWSFSFSFESDKPILFNVDYNKKELSFIDIYNKKISEFKIPLMSDESLFMAYKIK